MVHLDAAFQRILDGSGVAAIHSFPQDIGPPLLISPFFFDLVVVYFVVAEYELFILTRFHGAAIYLLMTLLVSWMLATLFCYACLATQAPDHFFLTG